MLSRRKRETNNTDDIGKSYFNYFPLFNSIPFVITRF